jgi:pimeloyl-ACP methyl ester carboxylesterase
VPYAAVGDVLLHYRLWGREGRRVALVHGSWGSHKSSEALADALAGECVVLAYDRRGHDASDAPPGPGSLADDVADLAGLLTVLEMAPAWLVGNSLGGLIALRTAAAHPHACLGVAAHEPPVYALAPDAAAGAAGPADETLATTPVPPRPSSIAWRWVRAAGSACALRIAIP